MSRSYKLVFLLVVISMLAALAQAQSSDKFSVNISDNKFIGSYLVNQDGFTLYYFDDDKNAGGDSSCYDDCATKWPPFYAENIIVPDRLRSVDFAEMTRSDGSKQTTFKGWPVYLYSGDRDPGDIYGNKQKNGLWHVINPSDMPQLF
ncbi:Secreted repeat of uncharacterised function [uncultured archaeon]|nr:Secreted repeat of uncharacterised function [uncultured archaeon]